MRQRLPGRLHLYPPGWATRADANDPPHLHYGGQSLQAHHSGGHSPQGTNIRQEALSRGSGLVNQEDHPMMGPQQGQSHTHSTTSHSRVSRRSLLPHQPQGPPYIHMAVEVPTRGTPKNHSHSHRSKGYVRTPPARPDIHIRMAQPLLRFCSRQTPHLDTNPLWICLSDYKPLRTPPASTHTVRSYLRLGDRHGRHLP